MQYKVVQTDALGHSTTTNTDSFDRVVQVSPPAGTGPYVSYQYDVMDRLTQAQRGGATTNLWYDYAGNKTQMSDPDMGTWYYGYEPIGNLTSQTDGRQCLTTLSYDILNRLTGKAYTTNCAQTNSVTYTYDQGTNGLGKRTGMSEATESTSWVFDTRGRMTSETKSVTGRGTFLTQWGYNSADLQSWIVYPADNAGNQGEQVFSTYNNQMLLDAVGNIPLTANYVFHTLYDEAGRARLRQLGRNVNDPILQSQYTYNGWTTQGGRLQQLTAGLPGTPTSLIDFNYSYSIVGNVLSILDNKMGPQTQSFGYDALNRLTSASATGGSQGNYGTDNYSYDPATGNLLTKAGITYTYADANHKHAVTSQSNGNTYQYDANGNMTQRVISGQTYTLGYDAENRLTQVTGAATANFTYDGDGNRILATEGVTTTIYIGNYFEWTTSTANMVKYYYAGGVRVAMKKGSDQVK